MPRYFDGVPRLDPEARRGADKLAAAHNAGIEAARPQAEKLTATLTRDGDTYRADRAAQEVERAMERGGDMGRDWEMER